MKKRLHFLTVAAVLQICFISSFAQTNVFPASGNAGIGTITPADKLTVLTPVATNGITHTDGIIKLSTYLNAGAGYIGTASNHPLCFRTNSSGALAILLQNGNFGIGTTSPAERLTVRSASGIAGFAHTDGIVKIGSMLNSTGALFGTLTNHPLFLRTNNSAAQVTLLQNGRVGIGTTTPVGLLEVASDIYVNGVRVGAGDRGNVNDTSNTVIGRNALMFIDPAFYFESGQPRMGYQNTAIGCNAMRESRHTIDNVAVGFESLRFANGGYFSGVGNVAVGSRTLRGGGSGNFNTAIGNDAMNGGAGGSSNTAVGESAMSAVNNGNDNAAIGSSSLSRHRTGNGNSALGAFSLLADSSGVYNTAVGFEAMLSNKSGFQNTAVGTKSLDALTTGFDNVTVGYRSADSSTSGFRNTALGSYSLLRSKTAFQNAALGFSALYNATSSNNVAVGAFGLYNTTSGSGNTALGYNANPNNGTLFNTVAIGFNAVATASNQVRIGNTSITSIGGFVNWTNVSDGRVKKNMKENVPGLAFINKLQPVTYNLSITEAEKITGAAAAKPANMEKETQEMLDGKKAKESILYSGFVAQDVEKAAKSLNYDFSGVDVAKNDKDLYGLRYAEFVVPLVKAVQELSKQNDNLVKEVEALKALIENKDNKSSVQLSTASLEQNVPNPFSDFTTISYTLPLKTTKAAIVITDNTGKKIKEINIYGAGKGTVTINTTSLNSGVYQYALYVSGILMDTKQMVVSRN